MKLTCSASALHAAFAAAARIVSGAQNTALPAVLLEASSAAGGSEGGGPGTLKLSATDRTIGLEVEPSPNAAALAVEEAGSCAVLARSVAELLASLAKGPKKNGERGEAGSRAGHSLISLSLDGETKLLSVGAEGSKSYAFRTYPTENLASFPKAPEDPGDADALVVPFGALRRAFARVTPFAAAHDASRPLLSATRLSAEAAAEGDGFLLLRAVSTDSYRLGLAEVPVPSGEEGAEAAQKKALAGVSLPARALTELAKAASAVFGADASAATPVSVTLSESAAFFSLGESDGRGGARLRFATSLVSGEYPDYERLLPDAFEREYEIDAAGLSAALKRAALFVAASPAGKPASCVTLTAVAAEEGGLEGPGLEVSAAAAETGSSRERVEACMRGGAPIGEAFAIHFNAHYLLDAVTAAASTKVVLKTNEPLKPAVVTPAGEPPGARMLVLIMPMRNPAAESPKGKSTPAA